jgi:hypothetical protein
MPASCWTRAMPSAGWPGCWRRAGATAHHRAVRYLSVRIAGADAAAV